MLPGFPLDPEVFKHGMNLYGEEGLVRFLNLLDEGLSGGTAGGAPAAVTTEKLEVYANSATGNDANDGLSESTPKKTIHAVLAIVPDIIKHETIVHLRGTFDVAPGLNIRKMVIAPFVIDGGLEVDIVDDNTGSNYGIDAATTAENLVATGSPGWSVDEHMGYWIEILDSLGEPTGQRRLCWSNAAGALVPSVDFDPVPTAGSDLFRVVQPSTIIGGDASFVIGCSSNTMYDGDSWTGVFLQGCRVNTENLIVDGAGELVLSSVIYTRSNGFIQPRAGAATMYLQAWYHDVATGKLVLSGANTRQVGFSMIPTDATLSGNIGMVAGYDIVVRKIQLFPQARMMLLGGRCKGPMLMRMASLRTIDFGDRGVQIDSAAGVGLEAKSSHFQLAKLDVSDCGSHGIELQASYLDAQDAAAAADITGSGNTGAGVYAHAGSQILFPDGKAPDLTGTVGDISTDGSTQAVSWAALDGGSKLADANEFVIAKEVA